MAYPVNAIVNTLLDMAKEKHISDMTPMKIQKLIYLAQVWYIKITKEQLIDESFYRWTYGPVLPSLYHNLKGYGSYPVTNKLIRMDLQGNIIEDYISDQPKDKKIHALLNEILNVYGNKTASQLSNLTHQKGTAWTEGGGDNESIITKKEMEDETLYK